MLWRDSCWWCAGWKTASWRGQDVGRFRPNSKPCRTSLNESKPVKLKLDPVRACEGPCETSSTKETCGLRFRLFYESTRGRLVDSAA